MRRLDSSTARFPSAIATATADVVRNTRVSDKSIDIVFFVFWQLSSVHGSKLKK